MIEMANQMKESLLHFDIILCVFEFKHNKQRKRTQFSTVRPLYVHALWMWAQNLWEWIKLCTIRKISRRSSSPV